MYLKFTIFSSLSGDEDGRRQDKIQLKSFRKSDISDLIKI